MPKLGIASLFLSFSVQASALTPMNVVQLEDGWPVQGEVIPGMSQIISVVSSGPYSWAIGLQGALKSKISFYTDSQWQSAVELNHLPGISRIVPLYNNGKTAQAFALGADKISYFNGVKWNTAAPVHNLKNILLLSSEGHAFAISSNTPIRSSFFDSEQEIWEPPTDLTENIQSINTATIVNGVIYLLGLNAHGEITLMSSTNNQDWRSKTFKVVRPQNMQIATGDHSVFVATMHHDNYLFSYTKDDGNTWHDMTWPGGMLFSRVNNGILWAVYWDVENKNIAYFDSNSAEPTWKIIKVTTEMNEISTYSSPSSTGTQICITRDGRNGAKLDCYDIRLAKWQNYPMLTNIANQIDGFFILSNEHFAALGVDKQDQPALFYYNGTSWQVAHVDGLLASVQNIFYNASSQRLWAVGRN